MVIPRDAVDKEDFDRMERGLPPRPKVKMKREEPKEPVVENRVLFENIPDKEIRDISARRHAVRNEEGVMFCGWDIYIEFQDKKTIQGWAGEGDFEKLKKRIPTDRTDLLRKIG